MLFYHYLAIVSPPQSKHLVLILPALGYKYKKQMVCHSLVV